MELSKALHGWCLGSKYLKQTTFFNFAIKLENAVASLVSSEDQSARFEHR